MTDWKNISARLTEMLRQLTFPVGVKLLEDPQQMKKMGRIRKPPEKVALCQIISYARHFGWTMSLTSDDNVCPLAELMMGFAEPNERAMSYVEEFFAGRYVETNKEAKLSAAQIPRLPYGKYRVMVAGPLHRIEFDPDLVIVYGSSLQMLRLIQAYLWKRGGRASFSSCGDAVCADIIAQPMNSGKMEIGIPCYGDRIFAIAKDDELAMSAPADMLPGLIDALVAQHKAGTRIPAVFQMSEPRFFKGHKEKMKG